MGRKRRRPIEYLPPAQTDIDTFAVRVCEVLAEKHDPAIAEPDVVRGLAEFMRIAARIQAKHLNQQVGIIDNDAE